MEDHLGGFVPGCALASLPRCQGPKARPSFWLASFWLAGTRTLGGWQEAEWGEGRVERGYGRQGRGGLMGGLVQGRGGARIESGLDPNPQPRLRWLQFSFLKLHHHFPPFPGQCGSTPAGYRADMLACLSQPSVKIEPLLS